MYILMLKPYENQIERVNFKRNNNLVGISVWSDLDYQARENIIRIMDMWILFHNVRISTSFSDCLQRLPLPNHVNFVARPGVVDALSLRRHREFTFTRFAAAQDQQYCQEQSTIPWSPLGHHSRWTSTNHGDYQVVCNFCITLPSLLCLL